MNLNELIDHLSYVVPSLLAAGILYGLLYFKSLARVYQMLVIYLSVCLAGDLLGRFMAYQFGNNLICIPISGFLELVAFAAFYHQFLKENKLIFLLVITGLLFIVYEAASLNVENVEAFQSYSRVVASFLITVMSIACFFKWIGSETGAPGNVLFLNSSILIYYAFNLICFLPVNFLINVDSDVKFSFWSANFLVTLAFYILLIFVIWKHGKNRKQLHRGL